MEGTYCYRCGHKNQVVSSPFYDTDTGKKIEDYQCGNKECVVGNYNTCDHSRNWLGTCKKCKDGPE
jgi:hypothetical protein